MTKPLAKCATSTPSSYAREGRKRSSSESLWTRTYCKQRLGLREIKTDGFLKEYWDVDSIKRAASEYKRRAVIPRGELCLADLIRYEGLR